MRWRLISTRRARLTASRVSRLSLLVAVAARARGGAVVTPAKTRGRLGNQLFQYASCYAIAVSANATFAARGVLGANARFAARGNEVCRTHEGCCGCGGEIPTASASERLDAPVWWDGRRAAAEVARVRAAVEADGTTRFACSGYRQSASFFANDPWLAAKVRDEFSRWSAATRARASELWSRHVLPAAAALRCVENAAKFRPETWIAPPGPGRLDAPRRGSIARAGSSRCPDAAQALGAQVGGDNVKYVALYQRTGDVYSQRDGRASCLPDAAFYERAVKRFRIDLGPAANVVYVTSNHTKDWRSWLAPAVDRAGPAWRLCVWGRGDAAAAKSTDSGSHPRRGRESARRRRRQGDHRGHRRSPTRGSDACCPRALRRRDVFARYLLVVGRVLDGRTRALRSRAVAVVWMHSLAARDQGSASVATGARAQGVGAAAGDE